MNSRELSPHQQLKISCLSRGIRVTREAEQRLSEGGKVPLTIHEYATTGGVTLEFEGGIFVNAPFDEWFCDEPEATLAVNETTDNYEVHYSGECFPTHVLPLPGYLGVRDSAGRAVKDAVMSHADRARLSPVGGCSFKCKFCDSSTVSGYHPKPLDQLREALMVAQMDNRLPVRHAVISGGTPTRLDYGYYDEVCESIIRNAVLPIDVMLWPRPDDIVSRLANWGAFGFALNIEVFDDSVARRLIPQKRQFGLDLYAKGIQRAVERTGGKGRVRSLILVGLEPLEITLKGVEFLAALGCDPTLSPFRPAPGTLLQQTRPPSHELLERAYLESKNIVERYGVKLGPRCIPCQHNTLTFPDGTAAYYRS